MILNDDMGTTFLMGKINQLVQLGQLKTKQYLFNGIAGVM